MKVVVGLDLSLTGAGVAVLADGELPRVGVIKSKPIGPTISQRHDRLSAHLRRVWDFIDFPLPPFDSEGADGRTEPSYQFVIEAPSYGSVQGAQHDRSGFWWMTTSWALARGTVAEIPPTVVKKFATGKGNASKEEVMWATARDFPGIEAHDDNGCDALWLAVIGRYHQDPALAGVTITKYRDAAVRAVAW